MKLLILIMVQLLFANSNGLAAEAVKKVVQATAVKKVVTPAPVKPNDSVTITPVGKVETVNQVVVRFNEDMIQLGDANPKPPVESECLLNGYGYWRDTKTWTFTFQKVPAPEQKCFIKTVENLKSLKGAVIKATTSEFETTNAQIVFSIPRSYSEVDDDQAFVLFLNGKANKAWIEKEVFFGTELIGDIIKARIIEGDERKKIIDAALTTLGNNRYADEEEAKVDAKTNDQNIVVLKAQSKFPRGKNIRLKWFTDISFTTFKEFKAEMSCERENSESPCIPLSPIRLYFTSGINCSEVSKIYLKDNKGAKIKPNMDECTHPKKVASSFYFKGPFNASTTYSLNLESVINENGEKLINQKAFPLNIKIGGMPPLLKFPGNFGILEAKNPIMPVTIRNVEQVLNAKEIANAYPLNGKSSVLTAEAFISGISKYTSIEFDKDEASYADKSSTAFIIKKPLSSEQTEVVGVPLKGKGLHIIQVESPRLGQLLFKGSDHEEEKFYVKTTVLVTDLGVSMKFSKNRVLVFVTSLDTGKPVENAIVQLIGPNGEKLNSGKSDKLGLCEFETKDDLRRLQKKRDPNSPNYRYNNLDYGFYAVAQKDDDYSFVSSTYTNGIENWRYSLKTPYETSKTVAHTILERNLLKPDEKLRAKIVLRKNDDNGLKLIDEKDYPSSVLIKNSFEDKYEVKLKWNKKNGTASFEWKSPEGVKLGDYSLSLKSGKKTISCGDFSIEQFKLPTMKVAWEKIENKDWVMSPKHPVRFNLQFISGGVASNTDVSLNYSIEEKGEIPLKDEDDSEYVWSNGGVDVGIFKMDDQPNKKVIPQSGNSKGKLDKSGSIEFDAGALKYAKVPQHLVYQAEYRDANGEVKKSTRVYSLWPSTVLLGIKAHSWMMTKDKLEFDVKAMDLNQRPLANQEVVLNSYSVDNYTHRKKILGGFYSYEDYTEIKKLHELCRGKTNEKGTFSCVGKEVSDLSQVTIVASSKDSEGHEATANTTAWLYGDEHWFGSTDNDRVDLIPFKKYYEPGEVAELQLRTPFTDATVLVTVESENVLHKEVVYVNSKDPIIKLPIKPEWSPSVVVSAFAIRGRVGSNPTSLLDLGKPAMKLGMAKIRIGTKKHELKVKVLTDKEEYRIRENVEAEIDLTDADNKKMDGEVAFAVIDEALLNLRANNSWDLLKGMIKERMHDVSTAAMQSMVIGKRHFGLKALPTGGDGAGESVAREFFDSAIYWNPNVVVKDGKAKISFKLKDSISSFRVVAVALSGEEKFGNSFTKIKTFQDVQITPALSTVIRKGDQFNAEFNIRNATKKEMHLTSKLKVNGEDLKDVEVTLAPFENKFVSWPITIDPATTKPIQEYSISVFNGKTQEDFLKTKQKIISIWRERVLAAQMEQGENVTIPIKKDATSTKASVFAKGQSSLLEEDKGLKVFWDNYYFNCFEQQTSRAISLNDKKSFDKLMERASFYTDPEGLIKYFPDLKRGDISLTQYVLSISNQQGWKIPDHVSSKWLKALDNHVRGLLSFPYKLDPTTDLYYKLASYDVLSMFNRFDLKQFEALTFNVETLPTIQLVQYFDLLNRENGRALLPVDKLNNMKIAINTLRGRTILESRRLQLAEEKREGNYFNYFSEDYILSKLILATMKTEEFKTDIGRMILGFYDRKKSGAWGDTMTNAWSQVMLRHYSVEYEKVKAQGEVEWKLGSDSKKGVLKKFLENKWDLASDSEFQASLKGAGKPWWNIIVTGNPVLKDNLFRGLTIQKEFKPIEARDPKVFSKGDIWEVTIKFNLEAMNTWIAINDPIMPGAIVIENDYADAIEKDVDSFRAYYQSLEKGDHLFKYKIRINQSGVYQFSPTRIEAMYTPEVFGEMLNSQIEVK